MIEYWDFFLPNVGGTCEDYYSNCETTYKNRCNEPDVARYGCQKTCGTCMWNIHVMISIGVFNNLLALASD